MLINKSFLEVKKSRFYGYLYEVKDPKEVKDIISKLKEEHKKASHVVYAYKINNTAGKSDDKEPTGTAGLPLYNILINKSLNNTLIVIVRYFGKTKLGVGNLRRAYQHTGLMLL